jgi:hypothetical protein
MKQLPAPTAKNINEAHRLARASAETAVEHAIRCGQMLAAKKADLPHGEFQAWVDKNCDFGIREGQRYMAAAAKSDTRVAFQSLRQALGYDKPKPKSDTTKGAVSVVKPEGGRTTAAKEGTEETGDDRPAAPVFDAPFAGVCSASPKAEKPKVDITDDGWTPDDDEDEILARAEKEYQDSVDTVMESDDRLTAARDEIKRQAAEIAALKVSRDGFMNGKLQITKMLKAEQRKVERLSAELAKLRGKAA